MSARSHILPVFIPHLGCPHACVFCNQNAITAADEARALETLEAAAAHSGDLPEDTELAFYGGSFTALPAKAQLRFLEAAQKVMRGGRVTSIRLSTRPDAIDAEILSRLKQYGVKTVELGAQSMRDEVLRLSGRGHTAEDVRRASRMIRSAGFSLVLQMMTGLPGDDDEGALETARELIALQPGAVRVYPAVVVRGTELERLWRAGEYREHSVEDAVRVCARLLPLFEAAGIPVIRLGLNPTDELSGGAALAGAYHPALGELVRSRILRNRAEALIEEELQDCLTAAPAGEKTTLVPGGTSTASGARTRPAIVLRVPPNRLSQMIGQKGCNRAWLQARFPSCELMIRPDPACRELQICREFRA